MKTVNRLQLLTEMCKCGVHLTINDHKNYYEDVNAYLHQLDRSACPPNIDKSVRKKMVETDTIVNLQFYPNTPIISYDLYHYDMDSLIEEAIKIVTKEE